MFDIATLLVSLTAVELIMSLVLFLFAATGQKVKGIIELALALIFGSLGSILAFFAAGQPVGERYLFVASISFIVGVLLSARAMRSLQHLAPRKVLEILCLGVAVVLNGWFLLAEANLVGMFVVNSTLFAVITGFAAADLLSEKRLDLRPACRILGVMFCLFAGFMALRALVRPFLEDGLGSHPQVTQIDALAALVAIAAAILWTVGFLWAVYTASEYRLKRANAELERFTGVVAHDLKAPLNSVVGFLGILKQSDEGVNPEKFRDYVNSASEAAWRMNEYIDDLLDQASNANQEQTFEKVNTHICSQDAIKNLEFRVLRSEAKFSSQGLPVVWGNRTQITRLFQNLYDNALKYQDPTRPPVVSVRANCQDGIATFSVSDNGVGVPFEDTDIIFDYMQRAGDRQTVNGVGLGLSECRRIVEAHGGVIWVEPASDLGTTFCLTLPQSSSKA